MPRNLSPRLRARLPEFAAVVLVIAVGVLGWVISEYHQTVDRVQHTFEVEAHISAILSADQAAELNSRRYVLTGDERYLRRSGEVEKDIESQMARFQTLTADNPEQQRALVLLQSHLEQHLAALKQARDLKRTGANDAARPLIQAGGSYEAMDQVRADVTQMATAERGLQLSRIAEVQRITVVGGVIASFALVVVIGSMIMWIWGTRHEARDLLATLAERERNETQIRHMQKMDAVGQMTGGLSHDLNNMLAVIISALTLTQRRLAAGDTNVQCFITGAMDGATRAATLTNRLMAFSRQLPLAPQSIDANRLVSGISELVQRTLGETIQTQTVLNAGLWSIYADVGQLENAVLNLCINAKDAMPEGGKLTIETANCHLDEAYAHQHDLRTGQYVLIAVTDTGSGMTQEVANKAFDPFFTTKDVGKGTGLGLSQVHGFIKQSGGHIKIYSKPGHGTTIKMYLPRLLEAGAKQKIIVANEKASPDLRTSNSLHTILVAEDDVRVNEMTVASLRELGYTVIHADGASSALEKLDAHPDIAMLFTDIVMPAIDGLQLGVETLRLRPDIKILYTSGFARDAIVHSGKLDSGLDFIAKPFTLAQISAKMTEMLVESAAA
jgi:signal transduction histidine kinase/ActR/RegA family two-component response regulator